MTVPSVSMKSDLGMAHPAPVNGTCLALGISHVTLRHIAVLLIALAAAPRIVQRERARQGRSGRHRAPLSGSLASSSGRAALPAAGMRERAAPLARPPLQSLQDRRKARNPAGSH